LVTALTELSAARIGAIIVLERQVALGEFIETGVRLDARVTADLLKTIFYPGTALHDMAVVIRGDRMVAARVQLPLAEAGSVDGVELGSRHRAALGITAGSDATCLVVSEETGAISVAQNGKLIRNVTEAQIRSYLASTVDEETPLMERLLKRHS
jgi:diadenylate cyclase